MRPWMKAGLGAGAAFSAVGIGFVAVSLFTDISRPAWVVFETVKGVVGFACCGLAGLLTARRTRHAGSGAAAGALGGVIAGITVPVSMYVLAYGFIDSVRQYPFEYYDYASSGAVTVQAFLLSPQGHADVLSTSIGLVPVVALFAAAVGGAVGFLGGYLGRGLSWPIPETTRPNTPLQPVSGEGKSAPIPRVNAVLAMMMSLALVTPPLQAPPPKAAPADVGQGRVAWFDITTSNLAASKDFYGKLFGWTFAPLKGTDMAVEIVAGGVPIGTLRVAEGTIGTFNGVVYVQVADIQASCAKAKELGGTIPPGFPFNLTDRPGAIAVVVDPAGHPVGMYSRTPLVKR